MDVMKGSTSGRPGAASALGDPFSMTSAARGFLQPLRGVWRVSRLDQTLMSLGWALRIAAILLIAPKIQTELYVPFIQAFLADPTIDPWTRWLDAGGSADAFPYGVVMLSIHTPFVFAGQLLDSLTGGVFPAGKFAQVGFAVSLLFFDVWLYRLLFSFMSEDASRRRRFGVISYDYRANAVSRFLVAFYWLSPLILYVNYVHGQTDIIPTFFVMSSIVLLERRRFGLSGAMLAVALSAKLSVGLVVPFLMIYLIWHPAHVAQRLRWAAAFAAGVALIAVSMWIIPGQLEIVLRNEALGETLRHGVELPSERTVLLFPLIYGGALAFVFFMAPLDRRTLYALIGLALLGVVAASSASVGWYMWALPLLLFSSANSSSRLLLVLFTFWLLVVVADFTTRSCGWFENLCAGLASPLAQNLLTTAITGLAALIAIRMGMRLLRSNSAYRLMNKPLFIGVAGDSGAGKDTIVGALASLVGPHRSAVVLGDDYHLYARGARMWKALTHLNPRANNLHKLATDVESLTAGRTVLMHHYDHATGAFTKPRKIGPGGLTLINGLHSLFQPSLAQMFDLRIFLRMDERLRQALKVARDVADRGKSRNEVIASIESRMSDSALYIDPQSERADLICGLGVIGSCSAEEIVATSKDLNQDQRLCVSATVDADLNLRPLADAFAAFCGASAILGLADVGDRQMLTVCSAGLTGDDYALLAEKLLSSALELLTDGRGFVDGHQGAMQLIAFYVLEHKVELGGGRGS